MDFAYKFSAVRGVQAGRIYYIAMVPLKMLSKLFPADDEYVLPEYRAQRKLNTSRIPIISRYILKNRDTYVFSALAGSIDGDFSFNEVENAPGTGILEVSMDSRFLLNDGQHRKAAILEALKEDSSIGDETISVVLFEDKGLERSQQIFTDLNKHAIKTSNSLSELYDSRDLLAVLTRNTIAKIEFLDKFTDKETDNLGKYSSNLFTLNIFYKANKRIIKSNKIDKDTEDFLVRFWRSVVENIIPWNEVQHKELSKKELRESYIITQGVVIQAFGKVGEFFYCHKEIKVEKKLEKLQDINWKRNAKEWKLRTIRADGRIIANEKAIILTSNIIKKILGLPLNEDEEDREADFLLGLRK